MPKSKVENDMVEKQKIMDTGKRTYDIFTIYPFRRKDL